MMIKEALEYLVGLREPKVLEVEDRLFLTNNCTEIKDKVLKDYFKTTTLQGIIDYIREGVDSSVVGEDFTIHIESPSSVKVYSKLNIDKARQLLVSADAIVPRFNAGTYMDSEMFNIELMSKFEPEDNLATIMQLAGTIKEGSDQTTTDDGITQRVTAKAGIARFEDVEIANPFKLVPFRTFPEVSQPSSLFVFRIRRGPQCALFDCGDTYWRNEAMNGIKAFLIDELDSEFDGYNVNIIM